MYVCRLCGYRVAVAVSRPLVLYFRLLVMNQMLIGAYEFE